MNFLKAALLAARDYRKQRAHEKMMRRVRTAHGSLATSVPKTGKKWRGVRHFRELQMVKVKVGRKSKVVPMLVALDNSESAKRFQTR